MEQREERDKQPKAVYYLYFPPDIWLPITHKVCARHCSSQLEYNGEYTKSKSFSCCRFYILLAPGCLEKSSKQKEEKVQSLEKDINLVSLRTANVAEGEWMRTGAGRNEVRNRLESSHTGPYKEEKCESLF